MAARTAVPADRSLGLGCVRPTRIGSPASQPSSPRSHSLTDFDPWGVGVARRSESSDRFAPDQHRVVDHVGRRRRSGIVLTCEAPARGATEQRLGRCADLRFLSSQRAVRLRGRPRSRGRPGTERVALALSSRPASTRPSGGSRTSSWRAAPSPLRCRVRALRARPGAWLCRVARRCDSDELWRPS